MQAMGPPRGARPWVSQLLGQHGMYRCLMMQPLLVAPASASPGVCEWALCCPPALGENGFP